MHSLKKIFNGASVFLVLLIVGVIINGFWSQPATGSSQELISFRVLSSRKNFFNQSEYFVHNGSQIFLISSPGINLNIGREYTAVSIKESYAVQSSEFSNSYLRSLGVTGEIQLKSSKEVLVNENCDWLCQILDTTSRVQRSINRKYLDFSCSEFRAINEFLAPNTNCQEIASLSSGLITGDTGGFQRSTNDNFKKLGLSHLVAVSGFQVVLLTSFVERILLKLEISKKFRFLIAVLAMLALILLVGPQPPVLRSTLTLLIIYLALGLGRGVHYLRALLYSSIIMLLINPFFVFSASFQLSFLASAALGSNVFHQVKPTQFFAKIFENISSTILIFLFTLPPLVNLAGFVSPTSIIVNLVLIPVIPIISIFNLFGLIPIFGNIFLVIPNIFQALLLFFTNDVGPSVPLLNLQRFSLVEIAIYYLVLIVLLACIKKTLHQKRVHGDS